MKIIFMLANIYIADKMCDQISDAVLDAHLKQDQNAKVACGELQMVFIIIITFLN